MGANGQAGGMMGTRFGSASYGTPLGNLQLQTQGNPTYGPSGVNERRQRQLRRDSTTAR